MDPNFDFVSVGYPEFMKNTSRNFLPQFDEPAFPCEVCRKVFKRKYHMKRHMDHVHGFRKYSK